MSEGGGEAAGLPVPGVRLLEFAVDRLVADVPTELDGRDALARARALLVARERLHAATLAAVRDVDVRELYALDAAGSTRGWLRSQLGGDQGQLALARRLDDRVRVRQALACGEVSGRGAAQLCAALDRVPAEVEEAALVAVVTDGLAGLLGAHAGRTRVDEAVATPVRAELAAVTAAACADVTAAPADRLEPAFLLLARHLAPGLLGWALTHLLDALLPEGVESSEADYYVNLTPVLDGDWDLRGHLDSETGTLLARELERRQAAQQGQPADRPADAPADVPGDGPGAAQADLPANAPADAPADPLAAFDAALAGTPDEHASRPDRLVPVGRRRHDALLALLRDLGDTEPGTGRPAPTALTVVATVEALEGRLGALPGTLETLGQPVSLPATTLQRLGCHSELNVVLVDALGNPVGASGTHRSATRKERAALRVRWGPWCAVAGCTRTATVPHHVRPWWLSRETVLRDLVPICQHDHRDLHEGHRTLRLKDGRLIDEHGWVATDDLPLQHAG